jgi:DNA-binding response OmpR family regulator
MAKILIVDDDEGICRKLSEILAEEGHAVRATVSGKEALKILEKEEFDVILSDLMMPGITGMEILTEAKKTGRARVIMITAFGTIENAVEAMKRGASDYITKPFKTNEIQVSVRRVLEEISFGKRFSAEVAKSKVENIFRALDSPIRRTIVVFLSSGTDFAFSEIMRGIKIDDATKLNFHLQKLKQDGLVAQEEDRRYTLSDLGKRALEILQHLGTV